MKLNKEKKEKQKSFVRPETVFPQKIAKLRKRVLSNNSTVRGAEKKILTL
jgi:hypothetical protein